MSRFAAESDLSLTPCKYPLFFCTRPSGPAAYKTGALNRSATHPLALFSRSVHRAQVPASKEPGGDRRCRNDRAAVMPWCDSRAGTRVHPAGSALVALGANG
jgi:hypothetical protein